MKIPYMGIITGYSLECKSTWLLLKLVRVEKQIFSMEDVPAPITISFGISSFTEKSYKEAIKETDMLMYKDKVRKKESDNI